MTKEEKPIVTTDWWSGRQTVDTKRLLETDEGKAYLEAIARVPLYDSKRPSWKRGCLELEWVLDQINMANNDRNSNRQAQLEKLTRYGLVVGIAVRCGEPFPTRPNWRKAI